MIHFAYIDAGTGSMALQAAIAGILSAAFFVKSRWASVRSFVSRRRPGTEATRAE